MIYNGKRNYKQKEDETYEIHDVTYHKLGKN